jgi:4-amino-4-deoxy-L-arabinose transferase-like glycosyltransferase
MASGSLLAPSVSLARPVSFEWPWPFAASGVQALTLSVIVTASLAFRVLGLSTYGFSEDEIHKLKAVDQYRQLNFVANAEHPMLMKLAIWGSLNVSETWNQAANRLGWPTVTPETALRLPNALAGGATTLALFLLADVLFGSVVALWASALWALDVNAIAINRIGKEDTFLLLFFLLAVWCYERAKRQGATEAQRAQRWYAASGAMFGLMLASKYMPVSVGAFAVFNAISDRGPGANRPDRLRMYGAALLTFLATNVVILMPDTWRYAASYVDGGMLMHHGSLYAGRMYITNIPISPLGLPLTFYVRYLATKVPLTVLAAAAVGVIELVRRRRERPYALLRVLLVIQLLLYSLLAAKFLRYMLAVHAVIDLVAAVGLTAGIRWLLGKGWLSPLTRTTTSFGAVAVLVSSLVIATLSSAPFYSLFQNAIGERHAAPAATFSEEMYDYGVREAVEDIAAVAEQGAVIVSDVPEVVAEYIVRSGRPDLAVRSFSGQGIPNGGAEAWVLVQDEHVYLENEAVIEQLRRRTVPWREIYARSALAVQIFRLKGR